GGDERLVDEGGGVEGGGQGGVEVRGDHGRQRLAVARQQLLAGLGVALLGLGEQPVGVGRGRGLHAGPRRVGVDRLYLGPAATACSASLFFGFFAGAGGGGDDTPLGVSLRAFSGPAGRLAWRGGGAGPLATARNS